MSKQEMTLERAAENERIRMMDNIKIGDKVVCISSGVSGVVVKQYFPTACEQQTMVQCADGRLYHAPTRMWRK